jgi:regulator of protease activity HflC (stomatin/prohibitin superfamily)
VTEFLQALLNFIREFWPVAIVKHWQNACWYRWGRFQGVRGPGPYFVIPFIDEMLPVNMVPAIIFTGRQDITLDDGSLLSWQAAATLQVVDPARATNGVDNYMETGREALSAVLADRLAHVDADRLTPEKRGRLVGDLTRWVNEEVAPYGLSAERIRFVTFVRNAKTLRLMQDLSAGLGEW